VDVPFLDIKVQNSALRHEILPLWEDILDSAGFIGGKHVKAFECYRRRKEDPLARLG